MELVKPGDPPLMFLAVGARRQIRQYFFARLRRLFDRFWFALAMSCTLPLTLFGAMPMPARNFW